MQFVCDAGKFTWFRIETVGEAALESQAMGHAVEKYFREAYEQAVQSHVPSKALRAMEQNIGRADHIQRAMPVFLTLRDGEGAVLVTAMLPPMGQTESAFRPILVGPKNADPYPAHAGAIKALAKHYGLTLDPARCYPYRRS
jgi:hypothetical protein